MTASEKLYEALCAQSKALGRRLTKEEYLAVFEREIGLILKESAKERKRSGVVPEAEQIYNLFPKKVGREDALRAISAALKKHSLEYLLDKTNQFRECVESWPTAYRYFQDGGDRCPHPASWYNAGRFADDPKEWRRHGAKNSGPQKIHVQAPLGWLDWLSAHMPEEDHPAHGQLLAALNLQNFSTLPASWQTKCIIELTGATLGKGVEEIENEMRLRSA
jgi:hypothetical protein